MARRSNHEIHPAAIEVPGLVGTPAKDFAIPYRGSMLRFFAGQKFIADAELRQFLDLHGPKVEWSA